MKTTIHSHMIVASVCMLLLAVGCYSSVRGRQGVTEQALLEQIKTKDDAIRTFGAPNNIIPYQGGTRYFFVAGRAGGGGLGLGNIVWRLLFIGREHRVTNTLIVKVDEKEQVLAFETLDADHIRRGSLWPFD